MALFETRKFILMIGDDGAVLALVNKSKVEKRLFATSASLNDRREVNALLVQYPNVPMEILLDTMEQSYTKQTLPAVSSLAIGKLVKKRLERDFAASDIKGAIMLGRDEEGGRRDWIYMFASAPVTSEIADWMDYIATLETKVLGIYMLPVEMENFVKNFDKALYKIQSKAQNKSPDKGKKYEAPKWQFIVTHNKTGGFRQVILHKSRVIFTRLIRPGKDNLPDIVAGNIEQEILNTIDYMRRLSFSDEDTVHVTAILSKELKKSLQNTKIRGNNILLYTPHEVSETLGMKDVAGTEDKFSDLVVAVNFAKCKPILSLDNPRMASALAISSLNTLITAGTALMIPGLLGYSAYLTYNIYDLSEQISVAEDRKVTIENKWQEAGKSDEYDINDANKITDAVTLHQRLSDSLSPLTLIEKAAAQSKSYGVVRSLSWSLDGDPSETNSFASAENPAAPGNSKRSEKAIFNFEFNTTNGGSVEALFKSFDEFKKGLNTRLKDYAVEISELPNTITFDDAEQVIPIKVTIETSSGDKNQPGGGIDD